MSTRTKTTALNQKGLIFRERKLPAKRAAPSEYFEFDRYWRDARTLRSLGAEIFEEKRQRPVSVRGLNQLLVGFMRDREFFERVELYRKRKTRRTDLLGHSQDIELTRRAVSESVGQLVGSFYASAWASQDQDSFMGFLVEEIIAANPQASVLEATARELRRTWKQSRPPPIAEVLYVLQRQAQEWDDVLFLDRHTITHWKNTAAQTPGAAIADDDNQSGEEAM